MNKKIKELAGFFPVPDDTESDWEYRAENARYEKFAELIIHETLSIVKDEVLYQLDNDMANYTDLILQ